MVPADLLCTVFPRRAEKAYTKIESTAERMEGLQHSIPPAEQTTE
jgi:hypothetical protein